MPDGKEYNASNEDRREKASANASPKGTAVKICNEIDCRKEYSIM